MRKLELGRKFNPPLILAAGDFIRLDYVTVDGVVRHERSTTIAGMAPDREMVVVESVVYESEIHGRRAIGVMLIEREPMEMENEHVHAEDSGPQQYRR